MLSFVFLPFSIRIPSFSLVQYIRPLVQAILFFNITIVILVVLAVVVVLPSRMTQIIKSWELIFGLPFHVIRFDPVGGWYCRDFFCILLPKIRHTKWNICWNPFPNKSMMGNFTASNGGIPLSFATTVHHTTQHTKADHCTSPSCLVVTAKS